MESGVGVRYSWVSPEEYRDERLKHAETMSTLPGGHSQEDDLLTEVFPSGITLKCCSRLL